MGSAHCAVQVASHRGVTALGAVVRPTALASATTQLSVLHVLRRMKTAGQPLVAESLLATSGVNPVTKVPAP
jgi:hypothetical protein